MGTRRAGGGGQSRARGGAVSRGARGAWCRRSPGTRLTSRPRGVRSSGLSSAGGARRVMLVPGRVGSEPAARYFQACTALWELCASSGFLLGPVPGCAAITGAAGAGVSPQGCPPQEPQPGFRNRCVSLDTCHFYFYPPPSGWISGERSIPNCREILGRKVPPEEQGQ